MLQNVRGHQSRLNNWLPHIRERTYPPKFGLSPTNPHDAQINSSVAPRRQRRGNAAHSHATRDLRRRTRAIPFGNKRSFTNSARVFAGSFSQMVRARWNIDFGPAPVAFAGRIYISRFWSHIHQSLLVAGRIYISRFWSLFDRGAFWYPLGLVPA